VAGFVDTRTDLAVAEPFADEPPVAWAAGARSVLLAGGDVSVHQSRGMIALDVALELDMPCGGWCPRGRKAEDGAIPDRYPQ
jgi:hypothetical protein